jgi:hypothetical protein
MIRKEDIENKLKEIEANPISIISNHDQAIAYIGIKMLVNIDTSIKFLEKMDNINKDQTFKKFAEAWDDFLKKSEALKNTIKVF